MERKRSFLSVKEMVEMALLISLAIVLDLDGLKISLGSAGGSIGFTMLPLFILGYRQGFIKSLIGVGVVYGITTNLLDGWGFIYYPFDYFVAYGVSISVASLFSKFIFESNLSKGYVFLSLSVLLAGFIRMIGHTLSSMIFYEYSLNAALSYSLIYVGPSILICLLILIIILPTLKRLNKKF